MRVFLHVPPVDGTLPQTEDIPPLRTVVVADTRPAQKRYQHLASSDALIEAAQEQS